VNFIDSIFEPLPLKGADSLNIKQFNFLTDLERKYDYKPATCYYCGKPLPFKRFYQQLEHPKKFCSKKCKKSYSLETYNIEEHKKKFSSRTEKIIYTYLTLQYPELYITYNIKDIFPPYEIDFCLETKFGPLYIEYNGSLHYTRKPKNSSKKNIQKHQLNDMIKKIELCKNRKHNLIRLWSEIGLYSNPKLFNDALEEIKETIDLILKNNLTIPTCIDIIVDKYGGLHKLVEYYREQ